jgi:hypothetical protein
LRIAARAPKLGPETEEAMQWAFTAEQQEFRSVLRRYFQEAAPTS